MKLKKKGPMQKRKSTENEILQQEEMEHEVATFFILRC
jgi:hypothetical protein